MVFDLKNTKIVIIVTLVVALVLAFVAGLITYNLTIDDEAPTKKSKGVDVTIKTGKKDGTDKAESLKVGDYTLSYGTYTGVNIEYDWDDEAGKMVETSRTEITLKLNSDNTYELSGEKHSYTLVGKDIVVPDFNNSIMFRPIGNDKIELQVGAGVDLTYSGK